MLANSQLNVELVSLLLLGITKIYQGTKKSNYAKSNNLNDSKEIIID